MRALGPGSVSSFLKIILDVIYVGLWIFVSLLSLFTLVALLFSFNPELLAEILPISDAVEAVSKDGPLFAGALAAWALLLGGWMVIVERLRRIFATLTAGDPFHPDNVPPPAGGGPDPGRAGSRPLHLLGHGPLAGPQDQGHRRLVHAHRLVLGAGGVRAGRGLPRGRPPSSRSRTHHLIRGDLNPCPSA
jgi:hypothetical protein